MTKDEMIQQLKMLNTTDLSDAMDRLGIPGQCLGIMPMSRDFNLAGRAFTLHYTPVGQNKGTVGDFIDDLGEDDVVVIDNAGRLDVTVWGDLLTQTAHQRKVAGTVIDGVCRDVDRCIELNYPIFSKGNWMRTGKDRVQVDRVNIPVSIGGVRVEPGDYLRGDFDGVVAIPASRITEVIEVAKEIQKAEAKIRELVLSGVKLKDARANVGYHNLQTRND